MNARFVNRRTLATVAVAVVAGVGSAAAVGFAQGNGAGAQGAGTQGSGSSGKPAAGSQAPGGILDAVHNALERLVAQGTIDQRQADAVQQQADAGSIDSVALVSQGILSAAQMQAVDDSLVQVKEAAAQAAHG